MYRIKELRLERGWTQEHLGHLLNMNKSVISKYENGKIDLTAQIAIHLSQIFQVSTDYLLEVSNIKTFSTYESSTTSGLPLIEQDAYSSENSILETNKKVLHYFNRLNEENQDATKGYMVHLYKDEIESLKTKK